MDRRWVIIPLALIIGISVYAVVGTFFMDKIHPPGPHQTLAKVSFQEDVQRQELNITVIDDRRVDELRYKGIRTRDGMDDSGDISGVTISDKANSSIDYNGHNGTANLSISLINPKLETYVILQNNTYRYTDEVTVIAIINNTTHILDKYKLNHSK